MVPSSGDVIADAALALSSSWFGAGLPPEAVTRLAAIAEVQTLAPGDLVIGEGQVADALGIVLDGRIALRMLVPERGTVTILTVEPGDVVGWSAVVPPYRGTDDAVAIEPVRLLRFPAEPLRLLLRADAVLAASLYPRLLQAVGRRLAATRLQLLDLFAREEWARPEARTW
ncbi:MAG: cyclic nucleotide-binding domain-containing protein [Chloroflexota bacterium]